MVKIAVVGSNSFSGSHFVRYCLENGHEVLAISRSPQPDFPFLPYRWGDPESKRFEFLQARIPEEIETIETSLQYFEPEYIVNFAALGMVAESWLYPTDYYKTNVLGNVVLHESLRKLDSLKKYVHVSTPEVYGHTGGYINEDAPMCPTTPYAASRAACDMHLETYLKQYNFPVVWTRAANVFGPGQQLYRIIPRTILAGYTSQKLQLHGGGTSERSFIHIEDVCKATLRLALESEIGEVYHLSTLQTVSIRALVELTCELCGFDFSGIVQMAPERAGKDSAYFLDSSKIRERFGWKDEISLDEGILETQRWIEANLSTFRTLSLDYKHRN